MSELGELTVRLSMESGNMSSQIKRLKGEMQTLDSGFQAAASQAGGFATAMDAAAARANMLQGKLNAANGIVERQKRVWDATKQALETAKARYEETGRKLEENARKSQDLESEIGKLKAAMKEEAQANGETSQSYQDMAAKMDGLIQQRGQLAAESAQLEAAEKRQEQAIANAVIKTQQAEKAYNNARTAAGQLAREVENANQRLKNHVDQLELAGRKLSEYGQQTKDMGMKQQQLGGAISSSVLAQAGTAAVQAAIQWEDAFAGAKRVIKEDYEGFYEDLGNSLIDMSKQGPMAAGELASIAQAAGQLGVESSNIVQFTDTMAKLAATTDLTADAAATAFAQYTNITGRNKDSIDRLGSMTLALGSSMATTESEVVAFASAIAGAGKQADMTDQEIFAISGTLASLGLTSQAGGTSFSKLIANMQVAAETGGESLKKFADIAGVSAADFAKAFKEDAAGAFRLFLSGLTSAEKSESAIAMLNEIGITEARMRDMILRASNATGMLDSAMSTANKAFSENTKLAEAANIKYNTTANKMKALGNQATAAGIAFGESMLPALKDGMDFVSTLIEKFAGLDESTRKTIVQWGLFAAGIGPAITVLGKVNGTIGVVSQGLGNFLTSIAANGGGLSGLLTSVGGLLGPAGLAAVAAGAVVAGKKLYDMASGAEAARQAQERLNQTVKDWGENVTTAYEQSQGMKGFGLDVSDFKIGGKDDGGEWLKNTVATWTDGKKETDQIVKDTVKGFTDGTDKIREGMKNLKESAGGGSVGDLDKDLKSLDEIDSKIETIMKKRQNGTLSESDVTDLQKLIDQRESIKVKYQLVSDTDGAFDKITKDTESALSRNADKTTAWADAYAAASQGIQTFTDSLNSEYDARYRVIAAMEDGEEKEKQMAELRDWYNEQAVKGQEKYAQTLSETAKATGAFDAGGTYEETMQGVEKVEQAMKKLADAKENGGPQDIAAATDELNDALKGLDEAKVAEMTAALVTMGEGGAEMSEGMEGALTALSTIKELLSGKGDLYDEAADSLNKLFGEGLDQEVMEINATLKTDNLTAVYDAWAAGEHADIVSRIDDSALKDPDLTGNITAIDWPEGSNFEVDANGNIVSVVTPEGNVYSVDAEGNVTGVTTKDGKTYALDIDGNVAKVTTADGVTLTIDASGNVTEVTWPEGSVKELDAKGKIVSVTTPAGKTYTVDAEGRITSVKNKDGVTFQIDAKGNVTSVTWPEGSKKVLDAQGNVTSVTTPAGTKYTLDAEGNITSIKTKAGVTYEVDGSGTITSVTTKDGVRAKVDAQGNVTDITWPKGSKKVLDAEGNVTSVTTPKGVTYTLDAQGNIVSVTTKDGVKGAAEVFGEITSLGLGADLDIPPIPVKAEVTEVDMPEDAPVYSSARGKGLEKLRDKSEKAVQENPAEKVPFIGGITDSTAEMVEKVARAVRDYNAALAEGDYEGAAQAMELIGSAMGSAGNMEEFMQSGDKAAETAQYIASGLAALNDPDVEVTPEQAENLKQYMAALVDTAGYDPSGLDAIAQAFQGLETSVGTVFENIDGEKLGEVLRTAVDGIDSESLGGDLIGGIGSGMANASVAGDAQTAMSGVESDLRAAAQSKSPAKKFMPLGSDIAAGIAKGMTGFSFAAAAGTVAGAVSTGFDKLEESGKSIGGNFDKGIASGITDGKSKVIQAARKVALDAAREAKRILEIKSPSRVGREIGSYYTEGIALGIESGQKQLVEATRKALAPLTREDGPQGVLADRAGWMDGGADQASLAALRTLSGDIRKLQGQRQAEVIDIEALAEANAQRPVVLQVGERELARTTMGATYDAQNDYASRIAFAYGK